MLKMLPGLSGLQLVLQNYNLRSQFLFVDWGQYFLKYPRLFDHKFYHSLLILPARLRNNLKNHDIQ